jgi:hypothetical protein
VLAGAMAVAGAGTGLEVRCAMRRPHTDSTAQCRAVYLQCNEQLFMPTQTADQTSVRKGSTRQTFLGEQGNGGGGVWMGVRPGDETNKRKKGKEGKEKEKTTRESEEKKKSKEEKMT